MAFSPGNRCCSVGFNAKIPENIEQLYHDFRFEIHKPSSLFFLFILDRLQNLLLKLLGRQCVFL